MSDAARRDWGWHRLTDEWARRVVADAAVRPGETVVDAGAGEGALTGPLLAAGARVIAVEQHPRRAALLRQRFAGSGLAVVEVDITEFRWPGRPFRVVANPPFAVTTALLHALLGRGSHLVGADLVLQRAAARTFAAGGRGATRWRRTYHLQTGRAVPRRAFRPPPRVDSAVLVVRRRR